MRLKQLRVWTKTPLTPWSLSKANVWEFLSYMIQILSNRGVSERERVWSRDTGRNLCVWISRSGGGRSNLTACNVLSKASERTQIIAAELFTRTPDSILGPMMHWVAFAEPVGAVNTHRLWLWKRDMKPNNSVFIGRLHSAKTTHYNGLSLSTSYIVLLHHLL